MNSVLLNVLAIKGKDNYRSEFTIINFIHVYMEVANSYITNGDFPCIHAFNYICICFHMEIIKAITS